MATQSTVMRYIMINDKCPRQGNAEYRRNLTSGKT